MRKTTQLRRLLESGETLLMPCAFDALSARIVQAMGIKATYITGYGLAATMLGAPDAGLASMTEVAAWAGQIADACDIPLICDVDQGWGQPINVARMVRQFEKAGVAGVDIDDQVYESCPYLPIDRTLLEPEEMVGKIRAALDAREDPDFIVTCKASVLMTNYEREGRYREEFARRARMYVEAGAYTVFTGWRTVDDLRFYAGVMRELDRPAVAIMGPFLPQVNVADLEAMGYRVMIYPIDALYAGIKAQMDTIRDLQEHGDLSRSLPKMIPHDDFMKLVGIDKLTAAAERYLPRPAAAH